MRVVRRICLVDAISGLMILLIGLFAERSLDPSGAQLVHPEFYYGFSGSALTWQLLLVMIASDPARFRVLMAITFLEKAAFLSSNLLLLARGRMSVGGPFLGGLIAWLRTPSSPAKHAPS